MRLKDAASCSFASFNGDLKEQYDINTGRISGPGAGPAAKDAELGAMAMVEADAARGLAEAVPHLERRLIGQQGAGDDRRPVRTLAPDHHARGRAHDVLGRNAEDGPARLGDRDLSSKH